MSQALKGPAAGRRSIEHLLDQRSWFLDAQEMELREAIQAAFHLV